MSTEENLEVRIREIGRQAALAEELLRLGFLEESDLPVSSEAFRAALEDRRLTLLQLTKVESQLRDLPDTDHLLREIRSERIAMVKARREVRKAEKERLALEKSEAWTKRKRTEGVFLGRGVSHRLFWDEGNPETLEALGLPVLKNLAAVAEAMHLKPEDLVWLCYERGVTTVDHYTRFEIPKRSGGTRLISSPKPKMRKAQSWINENILAQLTPSDSCFAFRPGTSIVDNASQHLDKKVIVKMDIKNFFPSISFERVRRYFGDLGYNPGVSSVLALLCTDAPRVRVTIGGKSQIVAVGERCLPQGACTSPALANLIASGLDNRLVGLLGYLEGDWTYTRYADDLTFSTSNSDANLGSLIGATKRIVNDEQFEINTKKTRIMRSPRRQTVTGLVVSAEVHLSKKFIRQVRALFHNIETKGEEIVSEQLGKNALNVAKGFWSYMYMVDQTLAAKYLAKHPWLRPDTIKS